MFIEKHSVVNESSYEYIKDSMLADTSVFSILLMKWSKTQDLLELFVLETRTSWRRQTYIVFFIAAANLQWSERDGVTSFERWRQIFGQIWRHRVTVMFLYRFSDSCADM